MASFAAVILGKRLLVTCEKQTEADDRCRVMTIPHMDDWSRWAKTHDWKNIYLQ